MTKYAQAINYTKAIKVLTYGPTWSGKTLSSLYLAAGIVSAIRNCPIDEAYKHVLLIDTEYSRGALYAKIGPYNHLTISAPYDTDKLVKVIQDINNDPEIDVIIIDSLTHFWAKEGGILDQKAAKDRDNPKSNTYTNWLEFTNKFNKMIDTILASPLHILTTSRAKTDTAVERNDQGKTVIKTYGLKPELRDDIDFEFDIVFNIDKESHSLIVEKGLVDMPPFYDIATPELGIELYNLVKQNSVIKPLTAEDVMDRIRKIVIANKALTTFVQLQLSGRKLDELDLPALLKLEEEIREEIVRKQT